MREARAAEYARALMADPPEDIVDRLATVGDGDRDHAQWELRYALRAIGYLVSERDALDDRTSSEVAAALSDLLTADSAVAADRRDIAGRQFNERLRDYRAALGDRLSPDEPAVRVARVLLRYARARTPDTNALTFAAAAVESLTAQCNEALREVYGAPVIKAGDQKT